MIETREGTMPTYEYGRIRTLEEKLINAGVDAGIIAEIMAGGSEIRAGAKPEKKSDWLHDAMLRMDDLLDEETRHAVRAACACCLGGKRHKLAQEIYQNYGSFEERVRAANETPYVFGHSVTLQEDGQVLVSFFPESESYRCALSAKSQGADFHHLLLLLRRACKASYANGAGGPACGAGDILSPVKRRERILQVPAEGPLSSKPTLSGDERNKQFVPVYQDIYRASVITVAPE
jgi:hypothetical protein